MNLHKENVEAIWSQRKKALREKKDSKMCVTVETLIYKKKHIKI